MVACRTSCRRGDRSVSPIRRLRTSSDALARRPRKFFNRPATVQIDMSRAARSSGTAGPAHRRLRSGRSASSPARRSVRGPVPRVLRAAQRRLGACLRGRRLRCQPASRLCGALALCAGRLHRADSHAPPHARRSHRVPPPGAAALSPLTPLPHILAPLVPPPACPLRPPPCQPSRRGRGDLSCPG